MRTHLTKRQKQTRRRLLEILFRAHSSHIGSCFSAIDIIDAIYNIKKKEEKFVLSNGHTAGALYVILEKYGYLKNPDLEKLGFHPTRNPKIGVDVSTGSLGQGLPIAVGMALARKDKYVYCLISDGECTEGSIWESFRVIHDFHITNIKIILSANGWGAYDPIDLLTLKNRCMGFGFHIKEVNGHNIKAITSAIKHADRHPTIIFAKTNSEQLPFLRPLDSHYYTMDNNDFRKAIHLLQ